MEVRFFMAILVYCTVFWWAFTYEAKGNHQLEYSEEPLELFGVSIEPPLSSGIKIYTMNNIILVNLDIGAIFP